MPELLRRSQSVATIFCSNFGFLRKKKKGRRSERSATILVFYWLCAVNNAVAPQTSAAYSFWREIKTSVFGGEKNAEFRKNSVWKCRKKISHFSHFFALIGNTGTSMHSYGFEDKEFIFSLIMVKQRKSL